jgi:hypothetical protein
MRAGSILTYPRQVLLRMPVTADPGRAGRGGNQFPGRVPGPARPTTARLLPVPELAAACAALGITHKRTRPYATETERRAALDPWEARLLKYS